MTSDYVKQLKLTKQLEQKAKEAAKNRSAAEERLKEAEAMLAAAKKIGAEIEAPEKAFKEASSLFTKKNYPGTLTASQKAIEIINTARKLKIMEILTSSEEILRRTGEDQSVRDIINKSHALADEGKMDEAYETARQANRMADKYSTERITELLDIAERMIALLKKFDLGVETRQAEVASIKKLIDKGDQKAAHERLLLVIKEAGEPLAREFEEQQVELRQKCELAAKIGLDSSKVSNNLIKAIELLAANSMVEAFDLLQEGKNDFSSLLPPQIDRGISKLLSRAELLGERQMDVSWIIKQLEAARRNSRSLAESMESMRKALDLIREMELNVVLLRIAKLRPRLAIAKQVNADLSEVMDKLEQVRDSYAMGNLGNALRLGDAAEEMLEATINGHQEVDAELQRTMELLGYCRRFKIKVNGAREIFNSSRHMALKGDFDTSTQRLKETQQLINFALQSHFAAQVMSSELEFAKAVSMGADLVGETEQLDGLIVAIKGGAYSEAPALLKDFNDALSSKIASRSLLLVGSAEEAIKESAAFLDASTALVVLREAEEARKRGEHEVASSLANRSLEYLRKLEVSSLEAERKKTLGVLDMLHRLHMDEAGIKEALKSAKKESKSPRKEIAVLREARTRAEEVLREVVFQSLVDLDRSVEAAKRNGVYVARSSRLAQDGIKALQGGDLEKAFLHYKEAEAEVARNSALHTEVYDLIIKLNNITNEISMVESKDLMESLKDAKVMFEKGRYKEAKEAAKICYTQIEREHAARIVPQHLQEARELMSILNQIDPLSSRFEPELAEVQKLMASGNSSAALSEAKKVTKRLSAALHASLTKEIEHAKKLCVKAEGAGASTLSAKDVIEKAERLIEQKRFSDALQAARFARAELNQLLGLKRKTIEELEGVQTTILNLDDIADISSSMDILGQAWSHQAAGRLGIASELGKKAVDNAMEAARKGIEERIEMLERKALEDHLTGPELDPLLQRKESILQRSNQGAIREAVAMATDLDRELHRLRIDKRLGEKRLGEAKKALDRARKLGLKIASIETMVSLAEKKFGEGAFLDSTSLSVQAIVDLEFRITLLNKVMPRIQATRAQIDSYGEWLPKGEVLSYLEDAEESLLSGDQHQAILMMSQASKSLAAAIEHFINTPVADFLNLVRFAPQLKIKLNDLPKEVIKCLDLPLKQISVSQADAISKATATMQSFLGEKVKKKMDSVALVIDQAREVEAEVSLSDQLLVRSKSYFETGELEDALQCLLDAERYIGLTASEVMDLRVKKERCEEFIKEGRVLGLDMEEAAKLLKEASQEKANFRLTLEKVRKAEEIASSLVKTLKPNLKLSLKHKPEAESDGWVHAVFDIENESDFLAHDMAMKFAEKMDVKDLELPQVLRAREKKVVEGHLKCTDGSNHILMELTYRPLTSQVSLATILSMDLPAT